MHPMFEHFLLSLVLVNTLCMAIEYEGMSQTYIDVLEMFNTVFTYMFMTEFLTKVWALGPKVYASDRFNIFDAVITILGFVQLMVR